MRVVLAFYGTRGDVDPGIAVGRELSIRGHDVCMAVPPDLVGSDESMGLRAVAYGPDTQAWLEDTRDFWAYFFRNFWRVRDVKRFLRESREPGIRCWAEMSAMLVTLAAEADLLVTGVAYQELVANVAEYHAIPLSTVLWFPIRVNGHLVSNVPAPLIRSAMRAYEWLVWRGVKKVEGAQRSELGLPPATGHAPRRIADRGSLEIQAYDEVCFPGLAAEWAKWGGPRPFVGALTIETPTDADDKVESWIAAGTPPIFFGFGSIPVNSPADVGPRGCGRLRRCPRPRPGTREYRDHRTDHRARLGTHRAREPCPVRPATGHAAQRRASESRCTDRSVRYGGCRRPPGHHLFDWNDAPDRHRCRTGGFAESAFPRRADDRVGPA